jgi:hypothetical protein
MRKADPFGTEDLIGQKEFFFRELLDFLHIKAEGTNFRGKDKKKVSVPLGKIRQNAEPCQAEEEANAGDRDKPNFQKSPPGF